MGDYGRLGLTIGGAALGYSMFGPVGGIIGAGLGVAAGMELFPIDMGTDLPSDAARSMVIQAGFGATSLTTQAAIPLVFGRAMLNGNYVNAYLLGEGNKRLLCVVALGEGTLSLINIFADGKDFTTLGNYSAARDDDMSWYEFYGNGQASSITIKNSGKKRIGGVAYTGGEVESYLIPVMGVGAGNEIRFHTQHNNAAGGSDQTWVLKGKEENDGSWTTFGSYSENFNSYVSYQVPSGGCDGGTQTETKSVAGVKSRTKDFSLVKAGKWIFKLEVSSASNNGFVTFEALEVIQDTGQAVNFRYNATAYCLINLVKTAAIASARFNFLVEGQTDNPASALQLILEDDYFGLNIGYEVDTASFTAAASWCNTKGYKVNAAFLDIDYARAIELIKNAGMLILIRTGGVYKCKPEQDEAAVYSFDEAVNILPGTLKTGFVDERQKFNRLRIKYADESENYTVQDLIQEDIQQISDDGYVREVTLNLSVVTNMVIANELANVFFKKSKFINIYASFNIGFQDAYVEIGDIITITSARLGFTDKLFRIMKIDEQENFGYTINVTEHYAGIYNPDYTINNWHPTPFEPPDAGTSAPPLVYIDDIAQEIIPLSEGGYQAKVTVTYTVPSDPKFDHVELWVKPGYSTVWAFIGTDDAGSMTWFCPEAYVDYQLKLVTVDPDRNKTTFSESPWQEFYPVLAPYSHAGYGGGRWGVQPYGS